MTHSIRDGAATTRRLTLPLALLLAMAALLGLAGSAEAKQLGDTTLKPNAQTFEGLADLGIGVAPTGPAKATKKGIAFPITGAKLDKDLTGRIEHKGGLKFESEGAKLKVKNFLIKIGEEKAKLFADAGGSQIRLLDLSLKKAKVSNGGKTVKGVKATLAKPAAEALSATFGADFQKGIPIGKATVAFK
jgi:hypothetical protein